MYWYLRFHPGWVCGVLSACWQRRIVLWLRVKFSLFLLLCGLCGYGISGLYSLYTPNRQVDLDAIKLDSSPNQVEPLEGDLISFGIVLPSNNCESATLKGQLCWDTDRNMMYIGDGNGGFSFYIGSFGPDITIPNQESGLLSEPNSVLIDNN